MACALCGTKTSWAAPIFDVPPSLAGRAACGSCEALVHQWDAGRLPRADLERLLQFAAGLDNPAVAQELRDRWKDPEVAAADAATKAAQAEQEAARLASILVTSGFDFQGRRITSYLGFVTRQVVFGMGLFRGITSDFADFFGTESISLGAKLDQANSVVFGRLREAVDAMGGNAIIGADLDYTMFGTTLVGVIASGTAVVLEPVG